MNVRPKRPDTAEIAEHTQRAPFDKPHFVIHTRLVGGHIATEFAYTQGAATNLANERRNNSGVDRVAVLPYSGNHPARLAAAYDLWQEAKRYAKLAQQAAGAGDTEWAELYREERRALLDACVSQRRQVRAELERDARRVFSWAR